MTLLDTVAALNYCLSLAPNWVAEVIGPVPLGGTQPLEVTIRCIIRPTRDAAEECTWDRIREICDDSQYVFNYEDWTITALKIVNGN